MHIKYVRSRSGRCFTFLTPCSYRLHATSRELHEWTRSDEKAAVAAVSDYANGEDEKKRTRGAELGGEEAVVCGC
jgi:hypothetical protein